MAPQNRTRRPWVIAALAAGAILLVLAGAHFALNADIGAWISSIHS